MACISPPLCFNGDTDDHYYRTTLETFDDDKILLESIAKQLQFYKPAPSSDHGMIIREYSVGSNNYGLDHSSGKKRAAVLVCMFQGGEGELRVILTKRSMNLSSHPGEVALPGGKKDEGDVDDSATALREAMEEIGLNPGLVRVVANLEPFISRHLLTVVPVVGLLTRAEDFKPVLNVDEVDAIFDVPLNMFLKDESYRSEEMEWGGRKFVCHLFDYTSPEQGDSFLIGGLTASILIRVATIIYQRLPSFTFGGHHHLPDFQQLHCNLGTVATKY